jgi:hypothetical protein
MCLLDGSVGGTLSSSVDFGTYEQEDPSKSSGRDKAYKKIKMPVVDIIREAVHAYAREPFYNIVVKDIPDHGMEMQEYRYDKPLYLWKNVNDNQYLSGTIDDTSIVMFNNQLKTLASLSSSNFNFDSMNSVFASEILPSRVIMSCHSCHRPIWLCDCKAPNPIECTIAKIDYGEAAGYK